MKKFANFLLFFFVNLIRNISFPRIQKLVKTFRKLLTEKFSQVWKIFEKFRKISPTFLKFFNWNPIEKKSRKFFRIFRFFEFFQTWDNFSVKSFRNVFMSFCIRGNEMFLMRFTKKNSKKFAIFFIKKIIQSLSIFRKSKNPEIFGKSKIEHRSISIENFQKSKNFTRKFQKFRKFSKIFWKSRKFFKLWRFFFDQKFCEFFNVFFLKPHQKDLISPNCWTVFHHSAMRFPEVMQSETTFSLFLTPDHQKRPFFY